MVNTGGQWHALIGILWPTTAASGTLGCYGQRRRPEARCNWLLRWPTPGSRGHAPIHCYMAEPQALLALAARAPLLEIGAGTGYWAHRLRGMGVDILAYDLEPPGTDDARNSFFVGLQFTEVCVACLPWRTTLLPFPACFSSRPAH